MTEVDGPVPMVGADPRRWWALSALVLSVLTIGFDVTILNVALPTIAGDLSAGTDALQWVVNAYVLVLAGLMLPAGALADRYGRKRLLVLGLLVFGAASLVAAWSDSVAVVIAVRALMGVGAAVIMPTVLAVLTVLFSEEERGRAVSLVVIGIGAGLPLGPIVGGYLLEHFWWGSIFLVNVPVAVVAVVAIAVLLPESRDAEPPAADLPGGVLSTAGLVAFVYSVTEAPDAGWNDPVVLATMVAGVALLAGFVRWELRATAPMIDLRLFRQAQFSWGTVGATVASFALFGMLFTLPQYLQLVRGEDALGTGVRLLPLIAGIVIGAPLAEKLAARAGYRFPVGLGLALAGGGLALGATTETDSGYTFVAGWLTAAGIGTGMALAPAMNAVLGALPPQRSSSGTALTMALRQAAGALGVALLGSLLSAGYSARLDVGALPPEAAETAGSSITGALAVAARTADTGLVVEAHEAFLHGMALALIGAAAVALLGAALTAAFLPGRPVR